MRNICLSATTLEVLARDQGGISATAIDLDSDTLYVASEYQTYDADVEVEISKIEGEKTIDVACQVSCGNWIIPLVHIFAVWALPV